jgi:hypothetical protein
MIPPLHGRPGTTDGFRGAHTLFVFVGKRGHTMKVLTWDGTGVVVVHKKLDAGKFELPRATRVGDQHVVVSDAILKVIYKGVPVVPRTPPGRALLDRLLRRHLPGNGPRRLGDGHQAGGTGRSIVTVRRPS